tara:strand:- start:974 stop:1345 length:372 start_codon:yes stop_codon:yes gene_type:complete
MNLYTQNNYTKLNDLCDQIFDYFNLTVYDLENKLDGQLSIENFKNKLDTFADKHFKSALLDFDNEIQNLKSHFPDELFQIEKLSEEIKKNFYDFLNKNILDVKIIVSLKERLKDNINKIKIIY